MYCASRCTTSSSILDRNRHSNVDSFTNSLANEFWTRCNSSICKVTLDLPPQQPVAVVDSTRNKWINDCRKRTDAKISTDVKQLTIEADGLQTDDTCFASFGSLPRTTPRRRRVVKTGLTIDEPTVTETWTFRVSHAAEAPLLCGSTCQFDAVQ